MVSSSSEIAFTQEEIKSKWFEYGKEILSQGKASFYHGVMNQTPKITSDQQITISIPNKSLLVEFEKEKNNIIRYLNNQFSIKNIEILYDIAQDETTVLEHGEDLYRSFLKLNKNLETFKSQLRLDL